MADAESSLPLELLERGDPSFVDAIRRVDDADTLAAFAEVWYADPRPSSRGLLLEYLDRPLNAYRHEGLVKRLFKKAEAAGDDQVMAALLVLFDRSIRRVRKIHWRWVNQTFETKAEAEQCASAWQSLGYKFVNMFVRAGLFQSGGHQPFEVLYQPPGTTMPRGKMVETYPGWPMRKVLVPDWSIVLRLDWEGQLGKPSLDELPEFRKKLEKFRLFSVATRHYLRRRAWRYFRNLGKTHPERYVAAITQALVLYRDADIGDAVALIDNWGLVHILFHHCDAIEAKRDGWAISPGRSLGELHPAPMFEELWDQAPGAVVGLLSEARSKTVRRWALRRIEADPARYAGVLPLEGWLDLLGQADSEIVSLAARVLQGMEGLERVSVDRWLSLLQATDPVALEVLCALIGRYVRTEQVTLEQAVKLAGSRVLPVAKLGFAWLRPKTIREPAEILRLIEAECTILRPQILRWVREQLVRMPEFDPAWIMEFLDARQLDARTEGWAWYKADRRMVDDFATWQKLLESPYDDIRLNLVAELEAKLDRVYTPGDLKYLWASVLLNIHRGSRVKPLVIHQLLTRLKAKGLEYPRWLPLLAIALRSVRGPERRAALVALVQLVELRAELEPLVRQTFPELEWIGEPAR